MKDVLIFDVDGTLLDTSCVFWREKEKLALAIQSALEDRKLEDIASQMRIFERTHSRRHGHSPVVFGNMIQDCFLEICGNTAANLRKAREMGASARDAIETWECPPIPGALEAVRELRDAGAKIALCTKARNTTHQREKLERWGVDKLADAISIVRQKGMEEILEAAKAAGMKKPEETWMIGDSVIEDVGGARAAGMKTAWIRLQDHLWHSEPVPSDEEVGATAIIEHVSELKPLIGLALETQSRGRRVLR